MKQKILPVLLLLSLSAISQEKNWTNRLEFQISSSFSQTDNNLRGVLWTPDGPKYQISINYALGWNTAIQLNKNIFMESGLSFIRRKNENADLYDGCFHIPEGQFCFLISDVNRDRRYHLFNIPLRIRLQKQLSKKLIVYWSGSIDNYFHFFTVYKGSDYKNKEKLKNYHGYSINTSIGIRYPLAKKYTIDIDLNSRLYEKYRQEAILGGNPSSFDTFHFKNINFMLSLNYYL